MLNKKLKKGFYTANGWAVCYESAIKDDGSLFFPSRLSKEFLDKIRKTQGSYIFSNQYQNEVIPTEHCVFKPEWKVYWDELPKNKNTFAFIDPAISQEEHADYTALTVVDVDSNGDWFVRIARRFRMNPTEIVEMVFKIADQFKPMCIGIEDFAYQKALLYMVHEKSKMLKRVVPVKGINSGNQISKLTRILGLVPRFEWGKIKLARGLVDLEDELDKYPRSAHDDILDSLSNIELIAYAPQKEIDKNEQPNGTDAGKYEEWYRRNIGRIQAKKETEE